MSVVTAMMSDGAIDPPYVPEYEVYVGSVAYGVVTEESDRDVCGFCIPPKEVVFPHLSGEIPGFGRRTRLFEQWQKQHVSWSGSEYDIAIYNITRFFDLCMWGNPNMLECLFVPDECINRMTPVGEIVRMNRGLFLSKLCIARFVGYARSELKKLECSADESGYDTKHAYHAIRLLNEAEGILSTGILDVRREADIYRAIRNGAWTVPMLKAYFTFTEELLGTLRAPSSLRERPDEKAIRVVLLECLERYWGNLDDTGMSQELVCIRQGGF